MSHQEQKSWFSRNWLWFIPLSGCLGILLLFFIGVGTLIFGVSKAFTNATPIEYAMEQASKNEKVIQVLGDPIEKDGFPNGNISLNNDDGEVDFSLPVKGSKGKATIIIRGIKSNGKWIFEDLYITIKETQEEINLLEKVMESI
ncbi:Cytochrome oxidase complex assembly protein 1 [Tenacibaculum sp. 190524A02b]|uniref:cytochrome c oxidase assembly factor Coa1 family protein n=1 Tax=Tenacibaculum vairaonense TaxID=3137860 RepID=UPI0032B1129D